MTDLEMTRLCAEAMGLQYELVACGQQSPKPYQVVKIGEDHDDSSRWDVLYDPLDDDAQAMALVKRFQLELIPPVCRANYDWRVAEIDNLRSQSHSKDLNRAIVECVAKMQQAKVT